MPTALVTGGAGFIGSHFVRMLLAQQADWQVVNLDALTYAGNLANLAALAGEERHRFVRGDIGDGALVEALLAPGVEAVVNLAAESHVDRSIPGAAPFVHTNIAGTWTLLEAARRHGVRRFLQVSTDEVYGSLGPVGAFTEATALAPNNPYAASKAGADLLVRAYHRTHGLPALITRCSNNYGPYQHPEKFIPRCILRALHDQPLPIYGDGQQVRDWIHVEDHCRALVTVLLYGEPGQVYNVGGGGEQSNLSVARRILQLLGKPASLLSFVPDRPGHDRRYAICSQRIEAELGWTARRRFREGLAETVGWYCEHQDWWAPLLCGEADGGEGDATDRRGADQSAAGDRRRARAADGDAAPR